MGQEWEQKGNKNTKVGQEWEQNGNKMGTRSLNSLKKMMALLRNVIHVYYCSCILQLFAPRLCNLNLSYPPLAPRVYASQDCCLRMKIFNFYFLNSCVTMFASFQIVVNTFCCSFICRLHIFVHLILMENLVKLKPPNTTGKHTIILFCVQHFLSRCGWVGPQFSRGNQKIPTLSLAHPVSFGSV